MPDRPLPTPDDQRIDAGDVSDLTRWAEVLCTTPEELKKAIEACGSRVGDVKRCLLLALLRRHNRMASPTLGLLKSGS